MPRPAGVAALLVVFALGCDGDGGSPPSAPSTPAAPRVPQAFDADLVRATPAAGEELWLAAPNGTPVDLEVVFSVSVPEGRGGTYNWNTVLQAAQPPNSGFVVPVVTTAFQPMALVPGVQEITVTAFKTTNAVCYNLMSTAGETLSLDIDVRAPGASLAQQAPQVMGKQFAASWPLRCR
jgi:hypothetical protein